MSPPSSQAATTAEEGQRPGPGDRLPSASLLAMALTGFVVIVTETLPAGLLPLLAEGLSVTEGAAGQLVAAYALGTLLAALPAVTATRGVRRRPLLVLGLLGFTVANLGTALAPTYGAALAARFVAGAFSGLLWGMLPGYARRIVPPSRAGRALAVAMAGTPVALAVGTPLGTFAGTLVGWRWTFAAMSVLGLALVLWVLLGVADAPGQPAGERTSVGRVLRIPGVAPVLGVVVLWMLGHNLLYTYVAPFLATTGVPARPDVVLLVFGVTALGGIWVTGALVDAALRRLALASLAAFAGAALALGLTGGPTGGPTGGLAVVLYAAVGVWGLSFGGAATQLNTAVADAAGPHTDIAATLVTTVWNGAIFGGSALGGILLTTTGARALPWTVLLLTVAALLAVGVARRHAFTPGPRSG